MTVQGIVTLLRDNEGFFVEQLNSDQDEDTSNALFVHTAAFHAETAVGSLISVQGIVTEVKNGRDTITALTELTSLIGCSADNPLPITKISLPLDGSGRESLEGMRIIIHGELTVNDVFQLNRGNFTAAGNGFQFVPTEVMAPGQATAGQYTENRNYSIPLSLPVEQPTNTVLISGSTVSDVTGVLAHDGRGLRVVIQAFSSAPVQEYILPEPLQPGDLRIVGMNLHNYFNGDGKGSGFPTPRGAKTVEEFHQQSKLLSAGIAVLQPHIMAVMELENDGFGIDSAASDFIQLASDSSGADWAIARPANDNTGSDKITVALFYRSDMLTVIGDAETLSGPEFRRSRQPIAQVFRQRSDGRIILVVINHLKSKGSCPDSGGKC